MIELFTETPLLNKVSLALFVVTKFLGIGGVALGFTDYRSFGGLMLAGAGLSLLTCVILCVIQMGRQNRQDINDEDAVDRMLKDGRLQDRLRQAGYKI